MAIVIKPEVVLKGQEVTFSLSKNELAGLLPVFNDSYFSNTNNWFKVNVNYRSSEGNQIKVVEFDATQLNPTGTFLVSLKARDLFQVQSIHIMDFDLQTLIIPRSELNVTDFDVELYSDQPILLSEEDDNIVLDSDDFIAI